MYREPGIRDVDCYSIVVQLLFSFAVIQLLFTRSTRVIRTSHVNANYHRITIELPSNNHRITIE